MRNPNPPFLELNFYLSEIDEQKALIQLVETLTKSGAKFVGEGRAHYGENIGGQRFASITDEILNVVPIANLSDMQRMLNSENSRLVQVNMESASGITQGVAEIVTYVSISEDASQKDNHPVAVWTDGSLFSRRANAAGQNRPSLEGKRIYEKFREILSSLRPSYAAITVSWPLECPTDLSIDPRTSAFRNFYISRRFIGDNRLKHI
ncbi:MAG TPA: hypothetical protein VGK87_07860, partial [Anaerolineae bacterium]